VESRASSPGRMQITQPYCSIRKDRALLCELGDVLGDLRG
jgi:hypothetical protein